MMDAEVTHVAIGSCARGDGSTILEANLGSCLGIALVWPQEGAFALAHCLLPSHPGNATDRRFSRFASSAPAHLMRRLRVPKDRTHELRAVLGGGASLYGARSSAEVGRLNIVAGRAALRAAGIKLIGHDVGSDIPRRIRIHGGALAVSVIRVLAQPTKTEWMLH